MPTEEQDYPLDPTKDTSDLRYPISNQNEIGNWLIFERKEYKKVDMFADSTLTPAKNSRTIILPLPQQLQKNYTSGWSDESLGIWGNTLRDAKGTVVSTAKDLVNGAQGSSFEDMIDGLWTKVGNNGWNIIQQTYDVGKTGAKALAADVILNTDFFRNSGTFSGLARNPYKAVLYESPAFRRFSFQYKMMAKNYQEAIAIREIVREFNIGAAPDFQEFIGPNDIYKYPDLFQLSIVNDSFLFKFAPCVCSNIGVDYHSDGAPVYIGGPNGDKIPASVFLTLEMQEVTILTKKEFQNEGA